jgi:signal transduction histidine kinase/CheY-like chemotaxis protein
VTDPGSASINTIIWAPLGRDAEIASKLVREIGLPASTVLSIDGLVSAVRTGAGLAIISDEAIIATDLRPLTNVLADQPAWSDFPIILLTRHGGAPERNPSAAFLADLLGNVSFLERPFHPTTLASVVKSAVRSRKRQYEARAMLGELKLLAENLETRVDERTNQLKKSEAALRQIQKMEVVGQLTGGIAHDFNNLLMAIVGNLDLLRKRHASDARSSRLIAGALQGAERGAKLTQRMLAFARQQDLQKQPINLEKLMLGMEDLLERSLGPLFELKIVVQGSLPPADLDSNQIELAILNLVINARDAMPDGGVITVTADYPPTVPSGLQPGRYVRIQVSDCGVGMSPETLTKAIEPFFSTKEVGRGTGLGLSMVHGLAIQHGGLFELSSEEHVGTTATLWLPAATTDPTPLTAEREVESSRVKAGTILVVDDDALIAMATVDMLEDLGHTVIEAHSGREALEIIGSGRKIDVMMTDHAMPGMTGMELAELVRDNLPDLPILLATGYAELPAKSKFDLPRISKPYAQDVLKRELEKLLSN